MKIKLFSLLLFLTGFIQANFNNDTLLLSQNAANFHAMNMAQMAATNAAQQYAIDEYYQQLLPSEKNFRRRLYWLDKNNPRYCLLDGFQENIDYYIAVLTDHIKVLEDKIAQKRNGLISRSMLRATAFSALSILCGVGAYYIHKTRPTSTKNKQMLDLFEGLALIHLGIPIALFSAAAIGQFKRVLNYTERLMERLARDKRILDVLKREKAAKVLKSSAN